MVESVLSPQRQTARETASTRRPTYVCIHSRNDSAELLYVSSSVREAIGYTPTQLTSQSAKSFIADDCQGDYPLIYDRDADNNIKDDEADVYSFYLNVVHADGHSVLVRVTSITCSSCVIAIGTVYHEITGQNQKELEVEMIDKGMKRINITRKKEAQLERHKASSAIPGRIDIGQVRNTQVKVAFILERADVASLDTAETGRRPAGPLIVFCTGAISHLIEADTSDVINYPFLKLVAPESVAYVSNLFDRLLDSNSVMFDTFALVKHPHIIDGDIFVGDEENPRIIVECLGAVSDDGVVLLLRHMRTAPAPKRDTLERHIQRAPLDINMEDGYQTLADLISSDGETSEVAGEWA